MKSVYVFFVALLLCSFAPIDWKEFTPENANCIVLMPGTPEKKEVIKDSPMGELKIEFYMYQAKDENEENYAYSVSFVDFPAAELHSDSVGKLKDFFDNTRDGAVKNVQGELLSEKRANYKNYPGREVRLSMRDGQVLIKSRYYLVKNRMYMLQVITPVTRNFNKSINKFLDSFKLIKE